MANAVGMQGREERDKAAALYFDEILSACAIVPDYRCVYEQFSLTFTNLLLRNTDFVKVRFSGPFARTSYLLKEHGADSQLSHSVNAMRVRLRRRTEIDDEGLSVHWQHDFKALAEFVALIYKVELPKSVVAKFPSGSDVDDLPSKCLVADVLRVIVESWDDEFIYCKADSAVGETMKVCYAHGNRNYNYDWTYIKEYLGEGSQLNLVRPRVEQGVVFPELIIIEPDLLVDVSAIARCFQDYGVSPLNHLIDKLQPKTETPAMTLGNLAGQFLDEEVNYSNTENTFAGSIRSFYKSNPLSMITSGVVAERDAFYKDALNQKRNIHDAINNQLPGVVGNFDPHNVILEPSFFSEMLGLQGRMDFLQLGHEVVIEQKSGKCGFPQLEPNTPVQKEQHYVQVLLYMLILRYNYHEQYRRNNGAMQAFLLYSKYSNSLLNLDFAPELVFKAIKVRNGIAWMEIQCAEGGFRMLDTITAASFLLNPSKRMFFERYVEPRLDSVLNPIQTASELEKSYFYRFLRFVETEHLMSKMGNHTKAHSGFASTWNVSLADKLQAGNIYNNLVLDDTTCAIGGRVETLKLRFCETLDNDMSNFRKGDIVILYPYAEGHEPDARRTIVFRCSIADISADLITLRLRSPQSDGHVFLYHNYYRWAIEHDFMESSYSSLYNGMFALLTAPAERRDLILLQREPKADNSKRLKGDYRDFNDLALRVKQAEDFFIILGPPGTGKTSFGLLNTLKEELLEPASSVLLMSYTNRAVDEICSKLVEEKIDFIRIGSEINCPDEYKPSLITEKVKYCDKLADMEALLRSARVYVGTTTSLNSHQSIFKLKQFSLAIIDEASQILEPHLMGLLCAVHDGECAIRKFVFIGDHKQLPAVVQQSRKESVVMEPELNAIHLLDCRDSLFQRFYRAYATRPECTYMLTRQGRMAPDISLFPSIAFYGGMLKEVPTEHQRRILPSYCSLDADGLERMISTMRVAFVDVHPCVNRGSDKINQVEADVIAAIVYRIYQHCKDSFVPEKNIGVIVPYRNQIATIRNTIERNYGIGDLRDITIDTVERYQGSQRDYIIYGFTVSRRYQLDFLTDTNFIDEDGVEIDRKLNVAMTRAREHLFLVGNKTLLSSNAVYSKLLDFVQLKHCLIEGVEPKNFVIGEF